MISEEKGSLGFFIVFITVCRKHGFGHILFFFLRQSDLDTYFRPPLSKDVQYLGLAQAE
jgi:hypothetical protein